MPAAISIITPWLDHPEFIEDYEASVRATGVEIIVVDNGSGEANAAALREMNRRLGGKYIRNEENRWFSAANNQGLAIATGTIILFLNNDIVAHEGWLQRVAQDVTPGGLFGPTVETTVVDETNIAFLSGWCISARREVWDRLGGWDAARFQMPYWEDVALSLAAARAGVTLNRTQWRVTHKKNGTSSQLWATEFSLEHNRAIVTSLMRGESAPLTDGAARADPVSEPLINHLRSGRLLEAERAYGKALEREPARADLWDGYGQLLRACGRFEASIAAHRRALELDPSAAAAQFSGMAMSMSNAGRHAEAAEAFAQSNRLAPGSSLTLTHLATERCLAGQYQEAIQAATAAIQLDPTSAAGFIQLSNASRGMGRAEESLAAAEAAVNLNPNLASAHQAAGVSYRALGRLADAVAALDRARLLEPRNTDIISEHAAVRQLMGVR